MLGMVRSDRYPFLLDIQRGYESIFDIDHQGQKKKNEDGISRIIIESEYFSRSMMAWPNLEYNTFLQPRLTHIMYVQYYLVYVIIPVIIYKRSLILQSGVVFKSARASLEEAHSSQCDTRTGFHCGRTTGGKLVQA